MKSTHSCKTMQCNLTYSSFKSFSLSRGHLPWRLGLRDQLGQLQTRHKLHRSRHFPAGVSGRDLPGALTTVRCVETVSLLLLYRRRKLYLITTC